MLDIPMGGVHGEVECAGITVPFAGQNLTDPGAAFVDAADISKDLLLRETEGTRLLFLISHTAIQPCLQICADVHAKRVILLQDDVGIPTDDDTVISGCCDLLDDFALADEKLCPKAMVKAQVGKTVPVGQLHIVPAVMTQRFPDMIRVHALVCGKISLS